MPVEDRLRRGLEANALAFAPEAEARLEAVRARRRRRVMLTAAATAAAAVTVVAVVSFVVGGRDASPQPAPAPTAPASSTPTAPTPTVPDSAWRRVIPREAAANAGVGGAWLRENFGDARRLAVVLSFVGDVYSQSARYPHGWSVGDAGTLDYDGRGRLVLSSSSPGCRGCVATLEWRIQDGRLSLRNMTGHSVTPADRLMYEGIWTRVDS